MSVNDKEFQWRVFDLIRKHGIPREDAEEIVRERVERAQRVMGPPSAGRPPQHVMGRDGPKPREVTLSIGGAAAKVRVSA